MATVGVVMCFLSVLSGTPIEPLPLLWILSSARWAYDADRYLDDKIEDTPESLILSLIVAVSILDLNNLGAWGLVESSFLQLYDPFKRRFPLLKPLYVGTLWTGAITVVPHLLSHVDVSSSDVISMGLLTTGVSNWADIKDVNDDRANGIHTIPVMFGSHTAKFVSGALFAGSVYTSGVFMHQKRSQYQKFSPVGMKRTPLRIVMKSFA